MNEIINEAHAFTLKDRKNLVLTGIKDIIAFDDKAVDLITVMGVLSIRGENIKILSFNTETKDMEITGKFDALLYTNDSAKREGFFSKLFR